MQEKTQFNNEEAVEYLSQHGITIRRLDFAEIIITTRIFMTDPGTYKLTPERNRGGRGYWITSKHALDSYIREIEFKEKLKQIKKSYRKKTKRK